MNGILLIDKPQKFTSHDVVNVVRRELKMRRIGHLGTLDPDATGLLIIAIGSATKSAQGLASSTKEYEFEASFGSATDTDDSSGKVIFEGQVPEDLESRVTKLMPDFIGEIEQVVPFYAAVKIKGVPLHKRVRRNEEVTPPTKKVTVTSFDLLESGKDKASFRIICSAGTYVRAICRDLGTKLGCGAHATSIRRLACGKFRVADALTLDQFLAIDASSKRQYVLPV